MKRLVCLGSLLFLIGFITRYLSKRALGSSSFTMTCFLQTDSLCSFSRASSLACFDGCGLTSYRNLDSAIGQLHHYPHRGLLAHRTCGPMRYMPSLMFRFTSMLLSTFDFRRRVSSCPRGFLPPSSPVLHGNFIYTDTAHSRRPESQG